MSSTINGTDMIVVQYVESSMSKQLLHKFPDNSAFGFDYSQSALWSPPIRRFLRPLPFVLMTPMSRRLSLGSERSKMKKKKKITLSKMKKRVHRFALNFGTQKRRLKFDGSFDTGSDSPPAIKKGWEKVLKIASKQFKWKKKKKDPSVHVKLSDYLQSQNY